MNKEMPHNIEAEISVLGAMFLNKYALEKACEALYSDQFYLQKHALIFDALTALTNKKSAIDLTTITAELKDRDDLKKIGGVEYLAEITTSVPSSRNIDHYIKIVEENALLRRLIETSKEIIDMGHKKEETVNEILDKAEMKIIDVIKNRKSTEFHSIQDVLFKTQAHLEKLAETGGEVTGVPSGFYKLDKITAGFHGKEFIVIASRPAMGKTAFALNVAVHAAKTIDKAVAVFSMEMGAEQLATRIIASLGQIDGYKLNTGKLVNSDWQRVNEAISQLADTKLYIDDAAGINVGEIRAKCRRLASSEDGLGLVVIDYLQLISGGSRYQGNRQQEISEISRSLKTMAMELDVPVIALAQLSRGVEAREDKRPLLSDLRESGAIEQDADLVAFLYRDDYYNKQARDDGGTSVSELIIKKHRKGSLGTIDLLFKKNTSTFLNYEQPRDKE